MVIAGLFLLIFHKPIRERRDNWNARVPWILRSSGGPVLTVVLIIIGALLIYVGIAHKFVCSIRKMVATINAVLTISNRISRVHMHLLLSQAQLE